MLAVSVDLLAGRYHATPWGRASNEGDVEWPPSPWRLGRALVSAWHRDDPATRPAPALVDALLAHLAVPPRFALPGGAIGHSRHYMPVAYGPPQPGGKPTSSPVLDAFVRTDGRPLVLLWEGIDLSPDERDALDRLSGQVGYLGRGESSCVLTVIDPPDMAEGEPAAVPLADAPPDADGEVVRVLCLRVDASVAALSQSTAERRRRGLDAPAGGRFIAYLRSPRALEPRRRPRRRPVSARPRALRFALEGPALPPVTNALAVAELLRRRALSRVADDDAEAVRLLRGADESGPLAGHRHCHYLATDEDGDGRIDHLIAWCPDGLPFGAVEALDVETLSSWALDHPLRSVLVGVDPPDTAVGPLATARRWRSHTPFLLVRHPKRRGGRLQDGPIDQVRLELSRRGFPPAAIEPLRDDGRRQWGAFTRRRQDQARGAIEPAAIGVRIVFDRPVSGPICLGRNSHFGMGLFLPT